MARRSAPRRKTVWAREVSEPSNIGSGGGQLATSFNDFKTRYGAELIGATLVRVRGWITMENTDASANEIVLGVCIGDGQSVAPGPISDRHYDWMAYEPVWFHAGQDSLYGFRFDVKSSRKLDELGMAPYVVVESSAGATISYTVSGLFMLS